MSERPDANEDPAAVPSVAQGWQEVNPLRTELGFAAGDTVLTGTPDVRFVVDELHHRFGRAFCPWSSAAIAG